MGSTDKRLSACTRRRQVSGAIIAVMATLKILNGPWYFCSIYACIFIQHELWLGFMLIHVLHLRLQAARNDGARRSNSTQQQKGSKTAQIAELAALIINIIRTQFIAILGNISIRHSCPEIAGL